MSKLSIKDMVLSKEEIGNFKILNITEGKTDYIDVLCICGRKVSVNLYGVYRGETKHCGCIVNVKNLSVGDYFSGGKWGGYTILSIKDSHNVDIIFDTGNTKTVQASQARSGSILNPLFRSVMGVGYMGEGTYKSRIGNSTEKTPQYRAWENMISRCYYPSSKRYGAYGGRGVRVCDEWLNFQNFASWFDLNWKEGCDLDKDILGDGMLYSPAFCRYIPEYLNKTLSTSLTNTRKRELKLPEGVGYWGKSGKIYARYRSICEVFEDVESASIWYCNEKTNHIRTLAETYYKLGDIDEDVFEVLIKYDAKVGLKNY